MTSHTSTSAPSDATRWRRFADLASLQDAAAAATLAQAADAIASRGRFAVVLAGGDTPRGLYERLRAASADWSRWQIWFGDERCVPADDASRNSHMAADAWLDHVPVPRGQVHPIAGELGPVEAAARYAAALESAGTFDLVLLGLGEDGHTGSLFPGHVEGMTSGDPPAVAVSGAPKPPPERVSLSAARFSDARAVLFLVSGAGKREAVERWRRGDAIPAASVRPPTGVDVFLDSAAAGD